MENFEKENKIDRKQKFLEVRNEFLRSSLLLTLLALFGAWIASDYAEKNFKWGSDAEQIIQHQGEAHFEGKGIVFTGPPVISTEFAHSGASSIRLISPEHPYAFGTNIPGLTGTETVTISVWRYNKQPGGRSGALVAEVTGILREVAGDALEREESGWEKLELKFTLDCRNKGKTLRIYCWNPNPDEVYFDDIEVEMNRPALWKRK